jgi:hypothetical protein
MRVFANVCFRPIADISVASDKPGMSKLALRYRFDDTDDFGWFDVAVTTDKFSGRGGFWVQWQDVREFGEKLSTYPIEPDAPLSAKWGYNMRDGDDLIVSIQISPANSTGDLRVRVELADDNERPERVRTSFVTNYSDLEQFRIAIAAMMDREADEAVLPGR